jgi:branched-chain amino acid transport system substrate-binding protein
MQRPKQVGLIGALAALALVAAACSNSSSSSSAAGSGGATVDCASDTFGCVQVAAGDPINIASLLSISGDTAALGDDSNYGVELAIDYLDGNLDGTAGQIDGHDVKLTKFDDKCSADGGKAGANQIAADPSYVGVIGTTCSSSALGVADTILSNVGMLLISPSNTNPALTSDGTHAPFYLRTAYNDKIQAAIITDFVVQKLQAKTSAEIHDESPYASALADVFASDFQAQGGTAAEPVAIKSTDTDFTAILAKIAQNAPDVLYFPDFDPACELIAQQAAQTPGLENTALIGSDGCLTSTYIKTGGSAVNGSYASGPDLSAFAQQDFYQNEFLPAYKQLAGTDPTSSYHAQAFDAFGILAKAIEASAQQESDGSLTISRTALKDALYATANYDGITGTITCTPLGDCAGATTVGVYQAPDFPQVKPSSKPVFSETKTLQEVGG